MMDLERDIVVAFPPVGEAFWSGIGPVGVLRHRDRGRPRIAVAVRVVSPFPESGEPFLPGVPVPVLHRAPPPRVFAPLRGREIVPFKPECDVGFVGTLVPARPPGEAAAGPSDRVAPVTMEVHMGDVRRVLSLPLSGARVDLGEVRAAVIGEGEVRLGPRSIEPLDDFAHVDLAKDASLHQSAGAPLCFPYPVGGTRIAVQSGFFSLEAELGFDVFVRVDYLDDTVSLPVARCDGVTFDLDRRQVEWVFRAQVLDPSEGREIERVVVAAFAPGQDEERSRVDAWLPHAVFARAAGPAHVRAGTHPEPLDDEELAMARYSTWDTGHFASALPIEEVARIQVELLRGKDRAAVLEAHGLDTYHFCLEERAALDRLAEAGLASIEDEEPGGGRADMAPPDGREDLDRYREAHARALAETPFEGRDWKVAEYAELRAALEVRNPIRALERAGLGPAEVIGLDLAMESRFEASAEERRQFEESFAQARARLEAAAELEDDFGPDGDDDDDGDGNGAEGGER